MKKVYLIIGFSIAATANAQQMTGTHKQPEFRINAYTGYVFDDNFDSYYSNTAYYNGQVNGGFQWGLGLEYMIHPSQGLELSYQRLDTKAPTTYYDGFGIGNPVKTREFDMGVNYIFLGSTRYFKVNPVFEPYIGMQLGMGIIGVSNSLNSNSETFTKFAWGLKGGANVWVSKNVGIKLQAGMNSVTQAVGGGLYFGYGGLSTGLYSYSSILQFSMGGGLVFRFGDQ